MAQPEPRKWMLALLIVAPLVAIAVVLLRRPAGVEQPADNVARREIEAVPELPPEPATDRASAIATADVFVAIAPPPTVDAAHAVAREVAVAVHHTSALDLQSAESTVTTQARLLRDGRDDEFIATFLPSVRARLTPRALERCRARVVTSGIPLRPDWEVADESVEDGHRVRRVSIYGHETTGFHEIDGRWLADRAWCVPTDVPDDA